MYTSPNRYEKTLGLRVFCFLTVFFQFIFSAQLQGHTIIETKKYNYNLYFFGMLGEVTSKYSPNQIGLQSADIRYNGLSGGAGAGYQPAKYFSVELAYLHPHKVNVKNINNQMLNGQLDFQFPYFDFRYIAPLYDETLSFSAALGAGYLTQNISENIKSNSNNSIFMRSSQNHWRPIVDTGLKYDLNNTCSIKSGFIFIPQHRTSTNFFFPYFSLVINTAK